MIAHRLNTIERCDMIIELKKGQINRMGNLTELYGDQDNHFNN